MKISRFARLGQEFFDRQADLHGEEFRLYTIIVFHTCRETMLCALNLNQVSERYDLDYSNTARRYKILREKGWCENTADGIRPLIGIV